MDNNSLKQNKKNKLSDYLAVAISAIVGDLLILDINQ
jgi:hypothetical protein